jgi:hypothetical protein
MHIFELMATLAWMTFDHQTALFRFEVQCRANNLVSFPLWLVSGSARLQSFESHCQRKPGKSVGITIQQGRWYGAKCADRADIEVPVQDMATTRADRQNSTAFSGQMYGRLCQAVTSPTLPPLVIGCLPCMQGIVWMSVTGK